AQPELTPLMIKGPAMAGPFLYWSGSCSRCGAGAFIEEQRLADQRLHHVRVEGLGHEERRLGTLPGQQPLGEGGDEDDRYGLVGKDIVDRVDTGGAVGELDVGKDHPRPRLLIERHRLLVSAGDG